MKKVLSLVVVLAMMLSLAALVPVHAATNEPIVFGYTSQFKDFPGYPNLTADDGAGYLASYNASKDAIEFTGFAGSGFYPPAGFSNLVVDTSVYKYMKVAYQANCVNGANACLAIAFGGSVWAGVRLEWGIPSTSSFTTKVVDLTDNATQINGVSVMNPDAVLGNWSNYPALNAEGGMTMSFNYADLGGSPMVATDTIYIKYVAFFADKAEADAFDIANYTPNASVYNPQPEASEPESSTPESSAPESSTPEASTPTESKPESSKPESSKPSADTGHGTLISGAVILFAAAAAVVAVSSKKR